MPYEPVPEAASEMMDRIRSRLEKLFWPKGPRRVNWGSLRNTSPVSRVFGLDRGKPIDRYYIEQYLEKRKGDIRGVVLEVGDSSYTERFGRDRVSKSEVLHALNGIPGVTIVGDLVSGEGIPEGAFQCMILTQVLLCVSDFNSAIQSIHRGLAPGGVALLTIPGISQISRYDMDRWGDYWRFTDLSARLIFEKIFGSGNVEIQVYGNVLAATAFLQGISSEELTTEELDLLDLDYQVTLAVRAMKRTGKR